MPLNNVCHLAVFVRNHDGYNSTTIVCDGYFVALVVSEDVQISLFPIDGGLKIFTFQTTDVFCFVCVHHINRF